MLAASSARLSAQVSTASMRGTIHDSCGVMLPGATLVLRTLEAGLKRESIGSSDFRYWLNSGIGFWVNNLNPKKGKTDD
jgi:hypothetical protein